EAMATGLPVVVTDVGGVSEVVTDGVTGLVVAPGSAVSVANAMLDLAVNPKRREEMGMAGLIRVQDGFSWDSAAAANLGLFEDLLARSNG
ncbi:MAG: glycosyltransferase, partial [Acidimicrobiia bacterium]